MMRNFYMKLAKIAMPRVSEKPLFSNICCRYVAAGQQTIAQWVRIDRCLQVNNLIGNVSPRNPFKYIIRAV